MGEYAKYRGERIKIGTCEDMYYLRADQREEVDHEEGNIDPVTDAESIRFRFPFPEEDKLPPGGFDEPFKTIGLYGLDELLSDVEHRTCQFTAPGFNACLPCPESKEALALPFKIHRNGYAGSVHIVQQRMIGRDPHHELWTVCQCGGCGAKFRLPFKDAELLAVRLRSENLHDIADRVLKGYRETFVVA